MTLLIPDRTRDNREDFIWCVPIDHVKWNKWFTLSEQFKTQTPSAHGGVRYMSRLEGKEVKTILVMPTESQDDEMVVAACAYLRLIKNLTCRMYIVRCTHDKLSMAQVINQCAGADRTLMVDIEEEDDGHQPKTD